MAKKPLTLSIIIPVFNEESHLKNCLDSIASQSSKPDEVLVVDNNSVDGSRKIAESYDFVKVIKEKKQGIVFARNKGFNSAKSEVLCRIDADTILPPNWVEHVRRSINVNSSRHAVTGPCSFRYGHLSGVFRVIHRVIYFFSSRLLLGHDTLFGSNMFITRSSWQDVNKSVCLRTDIHEDMDLAIHLAQKGYPIFYDKDLKAGLSMRRWHKGFNYPRMWVKTRLVH